MNADKLKQLQITSEKKQRPRSSVVLIFLGVLFASLAAAYFAWPRADDQHRVRNNGVTPFTNAALIASSASTPSSPANAATAPGETVLTVSGYIVNRERIELSPRFLGVVKWIGVKKGDAVTNGQIVVRLDDEEYKARLAEVEGRVASARTAVAKAELDAERMNQLARTDIESKKAQDDARLQLDSARASLKEAEGSEALARTYLGWCTIHSPINGVVLEKLVDPEELVVPQSFGGTRGPSTALIAVADPKDLQVEIDVNEADLSKISLNQKCRVSPEAYPEKHYDGYVAEIAPEADRAKGTLQIKVQIANPDRFLTPELSAKVDFLKGP
jgi:HlyD family secretion protein